MGFQADSEAMSAAYNVTYRYFKKNYLREFVETPQPPTLPRSTTTQVYPSIITVLTH